MRSKEVMSVRVRDTNTQKREERECLQVTVTKGEREEGMKVLGED